MDVILLERIAKLGQMGEIVSVKPGFARNFLLPQGKALRANEANKAVFEAQRAELEARNEERKSDAEKIKDALDGNSYVLIRSAGQTGQLYGSVSPRDIAAVLDENGFKVSRNQVNLTNPIKVIGIHALEIALHPEVNAEISVNVARSEDEAERQEAGEDLTARDEQFEHQATDFEDDLDLSEVFENPEEVELAEGTEAAEGETADDSEEQQS
ncbi:MAG: 50S ribosomal protein L9 [Rhizobiaceae bacterium]|nr:50S ribosomal protein L9 [Rhizobiaceae bacterium]